MLTRDAVVNGAQVMNNSWWDGGAPGSGYTAAAVRFDELVRDPNRSTSAESEYLVIIFSAGNSGPNAGTITPPKEAKNPIVVGNSCTFRPGVNNFQNDPDNIRGIAKSSSRGPAQDNRFLPHVVAPGTDVASARTSRCPLIPDPRSVCNLPPIAGTNESYMYATGTSMAAPHVAGSCALIIEWWRNNHNDENPSPAMIKALLINGAEDMVNGPDGRGGLLAPIPNNDQGWGRACLPNILLDAPLSQRGPKLLFDQIQPFVVGAEEQNFAIRVVDPARPLRITLVWTDAPGSVGDNPALTNDLDLEVVDLATGDVYKGNVFEGGFSRIGGTFDNLTPFGNDGWQDFALVIDNAEPA
jgi:hypothetical protein